MAEINIKQNELIKQFFDKNEELRNKLVSDYNSFIHSINHDNSVKYSSINDIFYDTNENYRKFHEKYTNDKYKFDIKFWYDMNKKQFIDKIDNYDNKVFYSSGLQCNVYYTNDRQNGCYNSSFIDYNFNINQFGFSKSYTSSHAVSQFMYKSNYKLEIIIDDYLNLYFPEINTIIIYNYTKFPLYSLFLLNSNIELNKIYSFNEHNEYDMEIYSPIKTYKDSIVNYKISQDVRNKFIDGKLFTGISEFIKYKEYIKIITPLLDLSKYIQNDKETEKIEYKQEYTLEEAINKIRQLETIIYTVNEETKTKDIKINKLVFENTQLKFDNTKLQENILDNINTINKDKIDIFEKERKIHELEGLKIINNELEEEQKNIKIILEKKESTISQLTIDKSTLINKITLLTQTNEEYKSKIVENNKDIHVLQLHITEHEVTIKRFTGIISDKDMIIDKLKIQNHEILENSQKDKLGDKNKDDSSSCEKILLDNVKQLEQEKKDLISKINELTKNNKDLENKISQLKSTIGKLCA